MATEYLTCKLCGFEFAKDDSLCQHQCPLGAMCNMVRCPSCHYEFPPRMKRVSWMKRIFDRGKADTYDLPAGVVTLRDLKRGDRARVLCVGNETSTRYNNLAVFGMISGAEVTLEQQQPSCVVKVGETELALDPDIAREILVEPIPQDASLTTA